MSDAITSRQTQILKSIIDEYIETAEAVGSESLEKKYDLGISPATIRNEMVALTKAGYLNQPHTSSGRFPSPKAMKFYVNQLMEERQMSLADEIRAKEDVWDSRKDIFRLIDEATHALAHQTKSLAVAVINSEDKLWHAGYSNVFRSPEFSDMGSVSGIFSLLDEVEKLHSFFVDRLTGELAVEVFFGEEIGWSELVPTGIVCTRFQAQGKTGALGVIGPMRLQYSTIVPVIRYFRDLIQEVAGE